MKYITSITPTGSPVGSGKTYEIEIEDDGLIRVDGQEYRADLREIAGLSIYSLLLDNRSVEVHVAETGRNTFRVMAAGEGYEGYEVQVQDELTARLSKASGGALGAGVDSAVKAPIPGLVVKVTVSAGDHVEAGQSLVILEAMKMENELRAPRSGSIATIHVRAGDSVNQGETLVTLH